jgi:hypothetical protein
MIATYSGLEYVKKPAFKELPPPRTRALAEGMFPASSETKLCAGEVEVLSIKSFWKFVMFSIYGLPYGFPDHSHPKNPFEASSSQQTQQLQDSRQIKNRIMSWRSSSELQQIQTNKAVVISRTTSSSVGSFLQGIKQSVCLGSFLQGIK